MDFLTSFSAKSTTFLNQTVEMVSKTNHVKDNLLQEIQQIKWISWNSSSIDMFVEKVQGLLNDSKKLISTQQKIISDHIEAKIVEEHIKQSVNLFSGSEHLQEILDKSRSVEEEIRKQTDKLSDAEQLWRLNQNQFKSKEIEYDNVITKLKQANNDIDKNISKAEAEIVKIKQRKTKQL